MHFLVENDKDKNIIDYFCINYNVKKNISRIISTILVAIFIIAVPILILPELNSEVDFASPRKYNGVIEFWHVETTEGGSVSRSDYLKARASEFEKKNPGTFIHITTLSQEMLLAKLVTDAHSFDLISFSYGCEKILPFLSKYDGAINTRSDLSDAGVIDGNQYALPYILGGYGLFALTSTTHKVKQFSSLTENVFDCGYTKKVGKNIVNVPSIVCGFGKSNLPTVALTINTSSLANTDAVVFDFNITQYSAYESFIKGKYSVLLGTQRDVYRLGNRESNGSIEELTFAPLGGFSDLIQFIGIGKDANSVKRPYCKQFVEYLTSVKAQQSLSKIDMFSTLDDLTLYSSGNMAVMEKSLKKHLKTINVFVSSEKLLSCRENATNSLYNGEKKEVIIFLN